MEKGFTNAGRIAPLKIVITGPESTGKTTLTKQLAKHFNTVFIPEYARNYIEQLKRPYTYEDLEHIAQWQIDEKKRYELKVKGILFLDTYLIITKVWFKIVYKKYPLWLDKAIKESDIDLFLLCDTDLPWESDNVRENGGEMRDKLFQIYKTELEHFGFSYHILSGFGENRLKNAVSFIEEYNK